MPLTLPNLDDRRYADLVEEARSLMVAFAPQLTNHNPSDPLLTLTELFAYFIDILLFRLNYVTDANRTAFLRLLNGPDWPTPSTREELEAAIRNTVLMLRQTDRAVTAADYEFLARAADRRVARAQCIADLNLESEDPILRRTVRPGHVSVVIVPAVDTDLIELQAAVADYLEPRRLLTTRVHVVGPRYVPLRVQVTLRLLSDALEISVRKDAVAALTNYFAPVREDGSGWPFGRSVHVSELYRLLDSLPGVDFVSRTHDVQGDLEATLDEIATSPQLAARLVRNATGELISIALFADELVDSAIDTAGIVIEQPALT